MQSGGSPDDGVDVPHAFTREQEQLDASRPPPTFRSGMQFSRSHSRSTQDALHVGV
jgi:hypothetical protein